MTDDTLTLDWTDGSKDVTVIAEAGKLHVTLDSPDVSFERQRATLETVKGLDVLDAGVQRDDSGERFQAYIKIGDRRDEIEQLREDSKDDSPLEYEVVVDRSTGSWGQDLESLKLKASKTHTEMTERERELAIEIDREADVPDDAEAGDTYTLEEILEDVRTRDEIEQDALDEAAESGEEVVINKSTTGCNDSSKECNLDHVARVATPDGDIETRRTHTY